jgi:hypothetical protein
MKRSELRLLGGKLLEQSQALRAAFPDRADMNRVTISDLRPEPVDDDSGAVTFRAALMHLREEMVLVRDGKTHDLSVMDDESAAVERRLPRM